MEKVGSTTSSLPATDRQKSLIEDILAKIPDANRMHEYHDYIQRPTRENASEFITQALENNLDIIAKKKNYMDYLANRPGVEIKMCIRDRNPREREAQDSREHPADGAGRHRIRKSSRESRCRKPWKRQQKIR